MPDHAGFAAAITVREHVLRTALQSVYANGSDGGKRFVQDLSGDGIGIQPDLFLGPPDIDCEGATNLLVASMPVWGTVTVTRNQVAHVVGIAGEMEITLTPAFKKGLPDSDKEHSLVLDQIVTVINARTWTARVTSTGTPADVGAVVTGEEFRRRFEERFRQGVVFGQISLPSIDASYLGAWCRSHQKSWRVFATACSCSA